jgi:hypothetical protein
MSRRLKAVLAADALAQHKIQIEHGSRVLAEHVLQEIEDHDGDKGEMSRNRPSIGRYLVT